MIGGAGIKDNARILLAGELRGLKLLAFVAIVIASIAIVGMIVALILLGLATSTVDDLKINSGCNDNNDCTYDYEKDTGGCINLPKKDGQPCRSECYSAEASDQTCMNVQLTPGLLTPICQSPSQQFCRGFCLNNADCPLLSTVFGDVAGTCFGTTCYYRFDPSGGVTIDGNEIPDLTCSQDYQIFRTSCMRYLNTSDTLIESRCIVSDVQCEPATTSLGSAAIGICYYYHACSIQQYIPIALLTRSISSQDNKRGENSPLKKSSSSLSNNGAGSGEKGNQNNLFNPFMNKNTPKDKRSLNTAPSKSANVNNFQPPVVIKKDVNKANVANGKGPSSSQPSSPSYTSGRSKLGIRR